LDKHKGRTGFVVIPRYMTESRAWQVSDNLQRYLMLEFILRANFQDSQFHSQKTAETIVVPKGSFVFFQRTLCKELRISRRTLRTFLSKMSKIGFSTLRTTQWYSMVTLNKYSIYQNLDLYERPNDRPKADPVLSNLSKKEKRSVSDTRKQPQVIVNNYNITKEQFVPADSSQVHSDTQELIKKLSNRMGNSQHKP